MSHKGNIDFIVFKIAKVIMVWWVFLTNPIFLDFAKYLQGQRVVVIFYLIFS